jgi:hypothetical protein
MHNLLDNMNLNDRFASSMNTPNCVKPLANGLFLTPLCDKFLQNTERLFVSWLVTFRVMDDEVFVVRRCDSFVDIGSACFEMLDILNLIKLLMGNNDRRYTAREALNITLISDDFPTPDYHRIHELNMQMER